MAICLTLIIKKMRTTFSLKFYCRPSKADKSGKSPIELSIIINGKRVFYRLPHPNIDPADFNRKRKPKDLQEYLDAMMVNINGIILDMSKNGVPVTANSLKQYIRTGGFRSYTVGDMFEDFFKIEQKRVGTDITQGSVRKYEVVRNNFYEQIGPEEEITAITPSAINEFYVALQQKYSAATAASYILKLKTIVRFAMDNDRLRINPFQGLKVRHVRKPIDYLTDEEINALRTAKIDNESLAAVRDAFLLQVYSGLAYVDLENLKEEDIKVAENGTHYIQKRRIKTGVQFTSVILPEGVEILMRNGYKMKVISNQKTNLYLKMVGQIAGIEHKLVTHLGRKTYGHILLNRGINIESVAKCLGHSNSRTTSRYYAELTTNTVINEVSSVFASL